jgi:hypothetical protein
VPPVEEEIRRRLTEFAARWGEGDRDLHVALDEAVATAYGWPASAVHDRRESNRLLLELNRAISAARWSNLPSSMKRRRDGRCSAVARGR